MEIGLKMIKFFVFIFCNSIFFFTPNLNAYIQIETGHVFHRMIDFEITDGKYPLVISRQYQQTKPGKSLLGERWCFDFEQQMQLENGGYRLYSCGNQTEVFFKLSGGQFVYQNQKMFEKRKGGLLRRTGQQETLVYNEKGYLVSKSRSGTKKYPITYFYDRDNRPAHVMYLGKYYLDIKLDKNGKVEGIYSNNKKVVSYTVTNNQLVSEKNGWGLLHNFEYDDQGLLTQIKYPDSTVERFSYNKKTKVVNDYVDKEGCTRKFDYQLDNAKSIVNLGINDSCIKQPPLKITLRRSTLFYKHRKEKQLKQATVKTTVKKKNPKLTVERDQFNRVSKIETAEGSWKIAYHPQTGRMQTISETLKLSKNATTYQVVYRHNKIVELSEPGKIKINFVYSKKGELLRTKSTAKPADKLLLMTKFDQIKSVVEDSIL